MIKAETVKSLREKTGVGMMECKKALQEASGDLEKAIILLRERGLGAAAKKAERVAGEGLVETYLHAGGRIGVLVEVNCETDFVAKTSEFRGLAHDLAMQIAAANPPFLSREEVPVELVDKERNILEKQALAEGKPANIASKMVEGRLEKFFKENCLLEQPFIKDDKLTIKDIVSLQVAKFGENIQIRRFIRYELGKADSC